MKTIIAPFVRKVLAIHSDDQVSNQEMFATMFAISFTIVMLIQTIPITSYGQQKNSFKIFLSKLAKRNLDELKEAKYVNKICWTSKDQQKICAIEVVYDNENRLIIAEKKSAVSVLNTPFYATASYGFQILELTEFKEALKYATTSTEIKVTEIPGYQDSFTLVARAALIGFPAGTFPFEREGYQGSIIIGNEDADKIGTIDELINGAPRNTQNAAQIVESTLKKDHADFYAYGVDKSGQSADLEWRLQIHDWTSGAGLKAEKSAWELTGGALVASANGARTGYSIGKWLGPEAAIGGAVLGGFVGPVIYLSKYAYDEQQQKDKKNETNSSDEKKEDQHGMTTTEETGRHRDLNSPQTKDKMAKKIQLLGESVDRKIVVDQETRQMIINRSTVTVQNTTEGAHRGLQLGALHIPNTRLVIHVDPNAR